MSNPTELSKVDDLTRCCECDKLFAMPMDVDTRGHVGAMWMCETCCADYDAEMEWRRGRRDDELVKRWQGGVDED